MIYNLYFKIIDEFTKIDLLQNFMRDSAATKANIINKNKYRGNRRIVFES